MTIAITAVLLLAGTLRTMQYLGRGSFQFDELSLVFNIQSRSMADLLARPLGFKQIAPAGFLAAVKAASTVLGVNELGLRLVPWLCALAAVVLFWRVSRYVLSGWALLGALVIFAASPALIFFAGNLKQYSGDVAATLLLVLLALRLEESPGNRSTAILGGLVGGATLPFSQPAIPTAAVLGLLLVVRRLAARPHAPLAPLVWLGTFWTAGATISGVLALRLLDPETAAYMARFWASAFPPAPWTSLTAPLWLPWHLFDAFGFFLLCRWKNGSAFTPAGPFSS
jgi:hypothetical protein